VSKVVLKRFLWHGEISVYDRETDTICTKGPGGVFRTEFFDRHDPLGAEHQWEAVETRMGRAYRLLDARRALDDPDAVATLRDIMAVHWARNPATRAVSDQITAQVMADSMRKVATRPDLLARELTKQTGLVAAGHGELDWINAQVHERVVAANREQWWSDGTARRLQLAREKFAESAVQVGYAEGCDFIIGDVPVITVKRDHAGVGPHQGVALGDAIEICMPISPTIIIGLGPKPAVLTLKPDDVRRYNGLQVRGFARWIGCRPGGVSDREMRANLPARTILPHRPVKGSR
jgi:hypothetical protein